MGVIVPAGLSCQELNMGIGDLTNFAVSSLGWITISGVVCGINPGWDNAIAQAALRVGVPLHVVLPHADWASKWSITHRRRCDKILNDSMIVTFMEGHLYDEKPADVHMVSLASHVVTLAPSSWEGGRLRFARIRALTECEMWPEWQEVTA